jgi:hypothetical protein
MLWVVPAPLTNLKQEAVESNNSVAWGWMRMWVLSLK